MITYRQNVDKLAEQQQSKYLDLYTILPSEISMQLAEVSLALGAIEDQVLYQLKYVKIPHGNTVQNVVMWHLMSFPHLAFSRFFQKREKFRKPEKLKRTSAQDSMTSLRNSKQSRLNSRKNLLMLITPKRRSRWVKSPGFC